jgi:hypothetical protein
MNWRRTFVLGVLVAGLSLTFVSRVNADPPPWAGVWRHNKHENWNHENWKNYDRPQWRGRDWDDHGHRREFYGRPYYGGYGRYRPYDPQYGKLMDRMAYDRAQIAKITPTGRHRKALQWYKDDLRNAQRDVYNYRYRGASYEPSAYDPYYQPNGSYDPYDPYSDTGRSFDWKNDWPLLVGQFLTQSR